MLREPHRTYFLMTLGVMAIGITAHNIWLGGVLFLTILFVFTRK